MKTYIFKRQQAIARPIHEVFRLFEKPENLEKLTPGFVGFIMLTPLPVSMRAGTVLDYTIRLLGIPVRWTSLIAEYEPPHRFVDVALRGPYSFWYHTHAFEQQGNGTIMTDEIHYALPLGPIGRLAKILWVNRQLNNIFDYRARAIRVLLEGSDPAQSDEEHPGTDSGGIVT
ncbi:MAG: SRPBCC family protein [Candidatus Zixiibacteriota bacterium]|nr:MAG: SRPBCC family protein [candidate division Zixibacteria bacterium]